MQFNKYDKQLLVIGLAISLSLVGWVCIREFGITKKNKTEEKLPIIQNTMFIKSPDFKHNEIIPAKFTCDGLNISPELLLAGIPEEAKSLVIVASDPDSATDWTHWLLWNIPPQTEKILSGTIPEGTIIGKNDFGKNNYGGPCPPSGSHHYMFTLYALDTTLTLDTSADRATLLNAMQGHVIDTAELVGSYGR